MTIPNRITLEALVHLPVADLVSLPPEELARLQQEAGAKHDAERERKGDVILNLIAEQGMQGKMYTLMQFASKFENKGSLGTAVEN